MHPYKDKACTGKELAKKRGYADGGSVLKDLTSMGLLGMAASGLSGAITDKERDHAEKAFVPKKSGGKVMKKGC